MLGAKVSLKPASAQCLVWAILCEGLPAGCGGVWVVRSYTFPRGHRQVTLININALVGANYRLALGWLLEPLFRVGASKTIIYQKTNFYLGKLMGNVNNQIGLIALVKRSRPINLITGPVIYSMIFPIVLLDICISFYQWSCFPIYGIQKFSRGDFIIFDRQELRHLDWISKLHCTYCAYGVGVLAFVSQVIDATEAYFCPIKHRTKNIYKNKKHIEFLAFEQPENFDFTTYLENARKLQTGNTKEKYSNTKWKAG